MDDTAPTDKNGERYTGPDVDTKTGELICPICGKPYSECPHNEADLNEPIKDLDAEKRGVGAKKEESMNFLSDLSDLLLEEFNTPKVIQEDKKVETKKVSEKKTVIESYADRLKHEPRLTRSFDMPVSSNKMSLNKALYQDHLMAKKSSIR